MCLTYQSLISLLLNIGHSSDRSENVMLTEVIELTEEHINKVGGVTGKFGDGV